MAETSQRGIDTGEYAILAARQIAQLQDRQTKALEALEVDSEWPAHRLLDAISEAIEALHATAPHPKARR